MKEKIHTISPLVDQFSRTISYLRLSLTDRCNLRCVYCMPENDDPEEITRTKTGRFLANSDLLSYEELLRIVGLAVSLGMSKIRLTGGEPLVRKGVIDFIRQLQLLEGLEQIRMTTNGVLLAENAKALYREGVRHLNISLDTLQPDKFKKITGRDLYHKVWAGLLLAEQQGFKIKINVVAMKWVNDYEIEDFCRLALAHSFQVRFIEFMPLGETNGWQKEKFIRADEIKNKLASLGTLTPFVVAHSEGPARMFDFFGEDGKKGAVGFISPISHDFCDKCNRLRLTSEGKLRACLLRDTETDLKSLLRSGATDNELKESIINTILNKPQGHDLKKDLTKVETSGCGGRMSRIGG